MICYDSLHHVAYRPNCGLRNVTNEKRMDDIVV